MFSNAPVEGFKLTAAKLRHSYGDCTPLEVFDEGFEDSPLWVFGNEFAATTVIRATSKQEAYDIWLDAQQPIPDDEMHEAYGFGTAEEFDAKAMQAVQSYTDGPDLIGGYEYQPTAGDGSGIVYVGDYLWYHEVASPPRDITLVFTPC